MQKGRLTHAPTLQKILLCAVPHKEPFDMKDGRDNFFLAAHSLKIYLFSGGTSKLEHFNFEKV